MSVEILGTTISKLRKEKNATQEELANFIGVSTQAVSKWECGGSPDTELLPAIADYFGVSIDKLFGRKVSDYGDLETETAKHFASIEHDKRIAEVFKHCWNIQQSIFGTSDSNKHSLEKINENHQCRIHSQLSTDAGASLMSLKRDLQYFMLMPEPPKGLKNALCDIAEYQNLFAFLASPNVLDCLYVLNKRENKPFTPMLLEKNLGISIEQATQILDTLKKLSFIKISEVELDDTVQKVYKFVPTPVFTALLTIATDLIQTPNMYYCYNESRNKPYLV